jgi:hypothetical protein
LVGGQEVFQNWAELPVVSQMVGGQVVYLAVQMVDYLGVVLLVDQVVD